MGSHAHSICGFCLLKRSSSNNPIKKSHNSPDLRCKFLHEHTQEVVHTQMNLHKFLVNPLWEITKSTKIMALILEKLWSEKPTAFEKYTVVFLPTPWVQKPVLLGWEKDVIPSSQSSTCSTGHNSALRLSWRTNLKKKRFFPIPSSKASGFFTLVFHRVRRLFSTKATEARIW